MGAQRYVEDLVARDEGFDRWYTDVVRKAELIDDAPVRGCKVIRPYGQALWERIADLLDARIKATGAENASFPLLVPRSLLEREAEHVAGFAPEVAWVTHGGDQALAEPLAVRPTSEALVCTSFARWVQSYRDLPILLNQWGSVVRWEERPRAFLRSLEFHWQEGHTCHATAIEASERARLMLEVYRAFLEEALAIPTVAGRKSATETFAGAVRTHTVEAMMGGAFWALQAGTAHDMGDRFGRAFGIRFLDRDGERRFACTTSWGMSHRVVGVAVMVHGDDAGLKLPPTVAPIQVVVVPIWRTAGELAAVEAAVDRATARLAEVARVWVDWGDDRSAGFKFNEWELKGVPLRLEMGPRDAAADQGVLVRCDTRQKHPVPLVGLPAAVARLLAEIQADLLAAARRTLTERTAEVETFADLVDRVAGNAGWSLVPWCGEAACEARIKAATKATIRCIPESTPDRLGRCVVCGAAGRHRALVARAY